MRMTNTILVVVGECSNGNDREMYLVTAFEDPAEAIMEVHHLRTLSQEFIRQSLAGNPQLSHGMRAELERTEFSVMPITLGRLGERYAELADLEQALLEQEVRGS